MRGVGRDDPCRIARPDVGQGTRSRAIRRGMAKKRATAIFDLSLRVSPSSLSSLLFRSDLAEAIMQHACRLIDVGGRMH
jgi:hypothetical protein